jgi:hypothetical protein
MLLYALGSLSVSPSSFSRWNPYLLMEVVDEDPAVDVWF